MERMDVLIIGAGIVGLSVARALSSLDLDVVLVEKEDSFGRHTSSRNSEVIHSGIYYPHGSEKARHCLRGNELLYSYCEEKEIPFKRTGKLVVACCDQELPLLEELYAHGTGNGVQGLQIVDHDECRRRVPEVKAVRGLWVPSTGIVDTHRLMKSIAQDVEENDAFIVYDMEAERIERTSDEFRVRFKDGEVFAAAILINCSGLFCESVARMAGIDIESENLKIHWCKGEYFKTTKIKDIPHLIYPLPDPTGTFLGIHLTVNLNGEVRFGPNVVWLNDLDYTVDESHQKEFEHAVGRYLDIEPDWLSPDDAGIRPKLQRQGGEFRDFHIREEYPGFINLMGIESPGLTSAPSIAEQVLAMVQASERYPG